MKVEAILQKFEQLTDAPNAAKKLRELVLQLAIAGKLVEQKPSDGTAQELLDKIEAHKTALMKAGKLRGSALIKRMDPDDQVSALPRTWTYVSFGEIMISRDGERIPVSKEERSTKAKLYDYYGASGIIDKIDRYLFDKPLLLIGEDGANLVNRSTPIAFIARGKYWVNNHAHVLDGISEDFLRYMEIHINAIDLKPYVTGSAQPKMNQAKMNSIRIAIPPLAEQKRIVAKVDELMALCDRLEARQQERDKQHTALARASLTRFADAPTPANLEFLFHKSYAITPADLRKSILTLAVQGKLVSQDPNEEPAVRVLQRIENHKTKLLDSGALRRTKPCRQFSSDEAPYVIPDSWVWTMLGEITDIGTGSTPSRTEASFWTSGSVPWITSGSTSHSLITEGDEFVTDSAVKAHRLRIYPPGTLLVALYGQGKTRGQVAELGIQATINQACAAVCSLNSIGPMQSYLKLLLEKQYDEVRSFSAGGAQPNLNVQKIKELFVPLPPLAEQRRIVAKVDQLMALVDQLEAQLAESRATAARLMEAVVAELTAQV